MLAVITSEGCWEAVGAAEAVGCCDVLEDVGVIDKDKLADCKKDKNRYIPLHLFGCNFRTWLEVMVSVIMSDEV